MRRQTGATARLETRCDDIIEPNEITQNSPAQAMIRASTTGLPLGPSDNAAVALAAPII